VTPPDDTTATATEPTQCLACRGTGTLISGLGGEPHQVRCPWCEGTGTRIAGIDAQAHPAEGAGAGSDGVEPPAASVEPPAASVEPPAADS
jgi:DnaJ-class molecular chaperone